MRPDQLPSEPAAPPPARRGAPVQQRLAALFALALALLNFPLLALWDRPGWVAGLPLFPTALFLLWGLLIAVLAWWLEREPG